MIEHVHTGWVRTINDDRTYIDTNDYVIPDSAFDCPACGTGRLLGTEQAPKYVYTRCTICRATGHFHLRTVLCLTK